jgi:hypothetical protein
MISTRKDQVSPRLRVCTSFGLEKKNSETYVASFFPSTWTTGVQDKAKLFEKKKEELVTRRTRLAARGGKLGRRRRRRRRKKKEWEEARRNRTRCGGLPPTLPLLLLLLLLLLLSINIHEVAALRPFRPYHSAASRPA